MRSLLALNWRDGDGAKDSGKADPPERFSGGYLHTWERVTYKRGEILVFEFRVRRQRRQEKQRLCECKKEERGKERKEV